MNEHTAEFDAIRTLQRAEGQNRLINPALADVFRVGAMNAWAFGAPCEGECDDLHCEYLRPILALATTVTPSGLGQGS